ncbi:MAG TPA: DAK2 domain-containing protein [Actinomycetales bacterium]|nr:DAK2 domain-containing protein [Actinomycetales bacterium]
MAQGGAELMPAMDGETARRWVEVAEQSLRVHRDRIDALNVFPVPDGDTGTNMHLTLAQALDAVRELPAGEPLGRVCDVLARAALLGARGNSGIITAQLLRGWADEVRDLETADASRLLAALSRADDGAWSAVEKPVEGTMLSVSRAAFRAAAQAREAVGVDALLRVACSAARDALVRTREQLPELTAAGVVDAGGAGVVLLLGALLTAVTGEPTPTLPDLGAAGDGVQVCPREAVEGGPGYEVMYVLEAPATAIPPLRGELAALGDSLVVVGTDELWHVHVHVDDPGAAVEAGVRAGHPRNIRITHFADYVAQAGRRGVGTAQTRALPGPADVDRQGAAGRGQDEDGGHESRVGVVAWAAGPGLVKAFQQSGVVPVVVRQGRRASTGEVLDAVRRTGAQAVVVLPNDPDTLAVARTAARTARDEGIRVTVVPTRAQVQGLSAAAVHDATVDFDQDVAAMSAAAGGTRHGAVTVAARDAITMAGPCKVGDVLGVVDGDFAVVGSDHAEVGLDVLRRLLSGGGEMVTLVTGQEVPDGLVDTLMRGVRAAFPGVEVDVLAGGQPRYALLIGVE